MNDGLTDLARGLVICFCMALLIGLGVTSLCAVQLPIGEAFLYGLGSFCISFAVFVGIWRVNEAM